MKKSVFFIFLFILSSCDAPQRTNLTPAAQTLSNSNNLGVPTSGQSPSGSQLPVEAGFETCDFSPKYSTIESGPFSLCQNQSDETSIKFKGTLTSVSSRLCLIPSYKDAGGSSTYIGQPQCLYVEANKLVSGKLYKTRTGFSSYPLNAVIVMREALMPEYFRCADAYNAWPSVLCSGSGNSQYCNYWVPRCPSGARSNAACDGEAKNYMNQICTSFKTKYSAAYTDIRLKN